MKPLKSALIVAALYFALLPAGAIAGVTLKTGVGYSTGSNPLDLAVGDLNGDGHPDIVTADNSGATSTALLGKSDGTFTVAGSYPLAAPKITGAPGFVVLGHFLGTGHLDAAVLSVGTPYQVNVLPGAGDGSFGPIAAAKPAPSGYSHDLASGVLTTSGKEGIVIPDYASQRTDVFLANGDGTFTTEPVLSSPGFAPMSTVVGDFNGDGISDVVSGSGGVWVYLGKGDGTFQTGTSMLSTIGADHLVTGDFNGDGKLDLAYLDSSQLKVGVLLGDGHGSFSAVAATQPAPAGSQNLTAGDLDSDGKLDVVTTSRSGNVMSIYQGNGDGTFAPRQDMTVSGPWQPVIADFNGDGNPDIAVGSGTLNQVVVMLSTPPTATADPGTVTFGSQTVGTPAPTQTVTLQNTAAGTLPDLAPPHLSLAGADPGDFSVSGCTAATAPGAGCQLTVGFAPTAAGARSATLTISDNAGTQTVALQGTAVAPTTPTTPTTPSTPKPPTAKPPTITQLGVTHRRWHETRSRRHGRVFGTTLMFRLDQPATVHLVFRRQGRKRFRATLSLSAHAGANRIFFTGRLSRRRRLPAGRYLVTVTAGTRSGQISAARTLRFTILA